LLSNAGQPNASLERDFSLALSIAPRESVSFPEECMDG
jgi:hypothetical protein